ncbi:MAG: hypothetical protein ACTHZ1_03430 [Sphingobacterium sp.]
MGILPIEFPTGETAESLGLTGEETFTITGISSDLKPFKPVHITAVTAKGKTIEFDAKARLDSDIDVEYFRHGGILHYVLRDFLKQ